MDDEGVSNSPDPAQPPPLPEPTEYGHGTPWDFWATTSFGLLICGSFLGVQIVVGLPFIFTIMAENSNIAPDELGKLIEQDGTYLSMATLATGILCSAFVIIIAWMRKGVTVWNYLGLRIPSMGTMLRWLLAIGGLVMAFDGLTILLGRDVVPEFMTDIYTSAKYPALLWIAIVFMAPLFEELFFRGFLFAGWSQSRLGVKGTILLTSLFWAAIHLQYDYYQIGIIFVAGIVMGFARHRTRSVVVPFFMHVVMNLIATLEVVFVLRE